MIKEHYCKAVEQLKDKTLMHSFNNIVSIFRIGGKQVKTDRLVSNSNKPGLTKELIPSKKIAWHTTLAKSVTMTCAHTKAVLGKCYGSLFLQLVFLDFVSRI